MEARYAMICRTVKDEGGNDSLSFHVTREEAVALANLTIPVFKKPVVIGHPSVTVMWKPEGLWYYDQTTPGAARGSMLDRASVKEQAHKVLSDAREADQA